MVAREVAWPPMMVSCPRVIPTLLHKVVDVRVDPVTCH